MPAKSPPPSLEAGYMHLGGGLAAATQSRPMQSWVGVAASARPRSRPPQSPFFREMYSWGKTFWGAW